jgi:uncharacterized protein
MNDHFVNVKVDREERPDVDAVYMDVVQALTGQGGWPMTVMLTPDGEPFYAGTYFPPRPRAGMPSFPQLLTAVADTWSTRRSEVDAAAAGITARLAGRAGPESSAAPGSGEGELASGAAESGIPGTPELDVAVAALSASFDRVNGGFGTAPKFPPSMVLEFLLRHHARTGSPDALGMVEQTCASMAHGGMYDQLGGGFARYSVDAHWTVPHFEKMLYDNALLLRVYAHLWRATGSALAERVVTETADFLVRDLRTPEGGFASALDADSAGVEGLTYVWTPAELVDVLGETDGRWAAELLAVTDAGTFEPGSSVLQRSRELDSPDDLARWADIRARLLAARASRPQPSRDDKVVAAWNGLAIAALAEAAVLLKRPDWLDSAVAAAELIARVHLDPADRGRLVRVSRQGTSGRHAAVLEDHADAAEGFLTLFSVTGTARWLDHAGGLLDTVLEHFADPAGGFFDAADDAERLLRRPKDVTDNATPSGNSAAAGVLGTFAAITGSSRHREAAESALVQYRPLASQYARFGGWGLAVAEAFADGPREVAVIGPGRRGGAEGDDVGEAADPGFDALIRVAFLGTAPGLVIAHGTASADGRSRVPLLDHRGLVGGEAAAYVCRGFVCDAPTRNPDELARSIRARQPAQGSP